MESTLIPYIVCPHVPSKDVRPAPAIYKSTFENTIVGTEKQRGELEVMISGDPQVIWLFFFSSS